MDELNQLKVDQAKLENAFQNLDSQMKKISITLEKLPDNVVRKMEETVDSKISIESKNLELKLKAVEFKYLKAALGFAVTLLFNIVGTIVSFVVK